MEVDNYETSETTVRCFKMPTTIGGNMKISCFDDLTTPIIVLWSKYELYVCQNFCFNEFVKIDTDFEIAYVTVINNFIITLDCSGNLNVNDANIWIICEQNIKCIAVCQIRSKWNIVCLQFVQEEAILLLNDSPNKSATVKLKMPNEDWMRPAENIILVCSLITPDYSKRVRNIFSQVASNSDPLLTIVCFDKKNVYAILSTTDKPQNQISSNAWTKLYNSHIDIVDIKITMNNNILILLALSSGTIIQIPLLRGKEKSEFYHLNTAIYKLIQTENSIIYTDALTLWRNRNYFSETDSTFEQFKVRNIRDFCVIKNKIICITYTNLLYSIDMNHRSSYLKSQDSTCSVRLVTNSHYLQEIMKKIEENEELLERINKERENLMALSLSERKDLMDRLIQVKAVVFDDFRDIDSKKYHLTLTHSLEAYYDPESYFFLINILVNRVHHKLNKILSNVLDDIKIHITLFEGEILQTTSIEIKEKLTNSKNFVIPLKRKNRNIKRMKIHFKIITNVPGKYDEKQTYWTTLYQERMDLNAENFIYCKRNKNNNVLLKDDEYSLDMKIYKRAQLVHSEYTLQMYDCPRYKWRLFIKMPYCNLSLKDILKKCIEMFHVSGSSTSDLLNTLNSKKICTFNFLEKATEGKNILEFQVGREQVRLDMMGKSLSVTSADIMVASDIRNILSRIIFNTYKDVLREANIAHKYYSTIETCKRDINECIAERKSTEEFAMLLTRFLRKLYCSIPI